jgi:hypothetical protein
MTIVVVLTKSMNMKYNLFSLGLTLAERGTLCHYCHVFTFVVGLEQCKNMGRQPNYEPFIVPVAAIPVLNKTTYFIHQQVFFQLNLKILIFLAIPRSIDQKKLPIKKPDLLNKPG